MVLLRIVIIVFGLSAVGCMTTGTNGSSSPSASLLTNNASNADTSSAPAPYSVYLNRQMYNEGDIMNGYRLVGREPTREETCRVVEERTDSSVYRREECGGEPILNFTSTSAGRTCEVQIRPWTSSTNEKLVYVKNNCRLDYCWSGNSSGTC